MNLRWKNLIKKLRVETKSQLVFEQVTGSMTECLKIDPWRRFLKKYLRDRVLREACDVLRDLFMLAQTNRLLLEEGRKQSRQSYANQLREQGRTFQRAWYENSFGIQVTGPHMMCADGTMPTDE